MRFHNLRIAVRQLLKSPGFSLTAVLMLAFGIAATVSTFSLMDCVILRPLPFPNSDRLVRLNDTIEGANIDGNGMAGVTGPDIQNYMRETRSFDGLGGCHQTTYELSGMGEPAQGEPAQINATRLSGAAFTALGVQPLMGRYYTQQEDDQKQQVAVISYSMWQQRLHGNARVLGTKILLDRKPYEIIGVMPRSFEFPLVGGHLNQSELWVPLSLAPEEVGPMASASWNYDMIGRLRPGVTPQQAQADAERVAQEANRNFPSFVASLREHAVIHSLHEDTVSDSRQLVRTLFLATVVVLLIACANFAGLLLVRAIRRRREIAVRLALGARAGALLRQAMVESLALSITGGMLGLVCAEFVLRVGVSHLPETLPRVNEIGLNWVVVFFALLLALLTGAVCGLAPAFAGLRTKVNDSLKEGGRSGSTGSGHARLRSAIVVGEIAIALVLLAACGLLLRSFENMREVNLGFHPDHILVGSYSLPQKQYSKQSEVDTFNQELLRRVEQLPGVKSVGITTFLPASGSSSNNTFIVDGYVAPKGAGLNLATTVVIQGGYLQALEVPLLAGRLFTAADTAQSQLVAIVNRKFAEHYWPGGDPLGKRFRIGTMETPTPWMTIVGEVADVKENSPDEPNKEQWYQPIQQSEASIGTLAQPTDLSGNQVSIAVRTGIDPDEITNTLRATVGSMDPQLPLAQVQTMEHAVSETEAPRRFNTAVISAFAIAAVLLAALGIYSVIAFSAALRQQEMAIRMALGSQRSGILRLIFVSAAKLGIAGSVIGLILAAAALHLLRSLLFNVSPWDPLVLVMAAAFVMLLASAASLLPALRAASIQPMKALRME